MSCSSTIKVISVFICLLFYESECFSFVKDSRDTRKLQLVDSNSDFEVVCFFLMFENQICKYIQIREFPQNCLTIHFSKECLSHFALLFFFFILFLET